MGGGRIALGNYRQVSPMQYEPNPKHKDPWQRGASGSLCPRGADGAELLAESQLHPSKDSKRYATDGQRAYCGHEHSPGAWHGFPVQWREVPEVLRHKWLAEKRVSRRAIRQNF